MLKLSTYKRSLLIKKQSDLIFIGDSLTQFHDWTNFGVHHNAGIAGDTTDGLLYRLHYSLDKKPTTIVFQMGINDLLQGQYIEMIEQNYTKIFNTINEIKNVIICSLLPVEMIDQTVKINEDIIILNFFLKQEVLKRSLIFVDLYSAMVGSDGGIIEELTSDGVHLTPKAYLIWESLLKDHL